MSNRAPEREYSKFAETTTKLICWVVFAYLEREIRPPLYSFLRNPGLTEEDDETRDSKVLSPSSVILPLRPS